MDKETVNRADSLIAIDHELRRLKNIERIEHKTNLHSYFKAIVEKVLGEPHEDHLENLFDRKMGSQDRGFVAVSLLRLFSIEGFSFSIDRDLNIKTYALFDEVFEEDIYPYLKIKKSQQTYEKERFLRDVVKKAEKELNEIISSLRNIKELESFLPKLMRALSGRLFKTILVPFLPKPLIKDSRLKEIINYVNDYLRNKASKKLKTLEKANNAKRAIEKYKKEAETYGTDYSKKFLVNLGNQFGALLKKDLQSFDESKPTSLTVRASEKKYPFHELSRNILISFIIENLGTGYAFDVTITASTPIEDISIIEPRHHLGRLDPGSQDFKLPIKVIKKEEISLLSLDIEWKNFDQSVSTKSFEFELQGQRSDLDWSAIELEQPYSLEAVETVDELIGREKIIKDLLRQSRAKSAGSSYIYGQKRVGKTSIAKALKSRLEEDNFLVIYLEGGEYSSPDPKDTVNNLGMKICERIQTLAPVFAKIPIPKFSEGALSPLADFLDSIREIAPTHKILFVLDEFDELPIDLYKRGPFGDSFFLTMRSISGKPPFGFILVGGEKMEFIMSCQGHALNKFRSMRVDYFDRENYWSDFQELVKRPVKAWFDVTDKAIAALYELTAGNPFYTKWICSNLFNIMIERRDNYITQNEVEEATKESIKEIASNSFQHFWDDGIFEITGDRTEEISIRRRKVLLAIADFFRTGSIANKDTILQHEIVGSYNPDEILYELNQLVRRHVLIEKENQYDCKVKFFKRWLVDAGIHEIMTTFSDLDTVLKRKQIEEKSFVKSEEIVKLLKTWGNYKGQIITEDRVRTWLKQFGENINQRLMFVVLQNLNFYTSGLIREKIKEAHGIVKRGLTRYVDPKKRKRSDILVSYLDGPGKSGGGIYAKLYADENGIYVDNVVAKNKIREVIEKQKRLNALVFVDDFIGTGGSAKEYFIELNNECGKELNESGLKIFFIAICGFQDKKSEVEDLLEKLGLPVNVHLCDPLDDSAKCFSDNSCIFIEPNIRQRAKSLAYEYGAKIVEKNYLGFGDCQSLVIFEYNCPNNNLPILWAESEDPIWLPLFKRL